MTAEVDAAAADPARWGVSTGYHDWSGEWRDAPKETIKAILSSMGAGPEGPRSGGFRSLRLDRDPVELGPGTITTEDGRRVRTEGVKGRMPSDLPTGYHRFAPDEGDIEHPLIVSPGRVPLPPGHQWGFASQLYATRSDRSWGMGDLADLRELNRWAAGLGAGFTLVNPLHSANPGRPQQPSPYYPGSRCFLNPTYIAVEAVPGAADRPEVRQSSTLGRRLNQDRRIDRDRVWEIKEEALRAVYAAGVASGDRGHEDFAAYRRRRGAPLERFACFQALAETHGTLWRDWPEELRHPDRPGVDEFARSAEGRDAIRWHSWLQWLADSQADRAAQECGLVIDLAVGVDPSGADSWIWQDSFSEGMRVGAPPDEFNTRGQDWGLPPFDPWRLRQGGYEPWVQALRSGMAHAKGLRVDHVMGLFRLFWIPEGSEPTAGAYVRYRSSEMLDILALEAERAGAHVVGEDLGTVEDEVRRDLADRRIMSYRLWWFEDRTPDEWPELAMGAVTTHDLPTVAGVISGSDLQAQREMGTDPNEESSAALARRIEERAGDGTTEEVIEAVYADLAKAPCYLLTVTLDDALAVEERPNMPGTIDEWPNWSLSLPAPLEDLEKAPLAAALAALFRDRPVAAAD